MSHARVRKLFSAALDVYAEGKGYKVSYDNVKASLPNDVRIKAHLMPAETFSDTLNGSDHTGFIGLYQMIIETKYGTGTLQSELVVEDLSEIFVCDKVLADETGFSVQIITPLKAAEGKQIDGVWVVPTYFNYRSDIN